MNVKDFHDWRRNKMVLGNTGESKIWKNSANCYHDSTTNCYHDLILEKLNIIIFILRKTKI